ncbi:MAG: hypothetical protein PPHEESC_6331 [uncultured Paraburkholderia sp.]|nr:MAG: hypothetical protein PPHEESC_6331 [uncultured Paraburkholderia sp.]
MATETYILVRMIQVSIAEREAELVMLQLSMANTHLSFERYLEATNVLAMLEHELGRWRALLDFVRAEF